MAQTRLNDRQMAFFETFGFLQFPGLLADCIDEIIDEFEAVCDTGALRVIPGSHRPGDTYADFLQERIRQSDSLWGVEGRDVPAYALESEPGDVVCFNHNTKHASFGGSPRRRMFTINCHARYSEDRLDELREYIGHSARFWLERVYGEAMIRTAGPQRMVHLEPMLANDGHLAELSRRKRAEMTERSRG